MRLILSQLFVPTDDMKPRPDGTVVMVSLDDMSIGPRAAWPDTQRFYADRAAAFLASVTSDLPDGTKMDYDAWYCPLPRIDPLKWLAEHPDDPDGFLEPLTFDAALAAADAIELWYGSTTVQGLVWLWWTTAELARHGITPPQVRDCDLKASRYGRIDAATFDAMLHDAPDRAYRASPIDAATLERRLALWQAVTQFPTPPAGHLHPSEAEARCFDVLSGRFPDGPEGLNALEKQLLAALTPDFAPMVRPTADAMIAQQDVGDYLDIDHLHDLLLGLAQRTPPLVEVSGAGPMHKCAVRLTGAGVQVQSTP
ncbi:MAG: hypothetical protein AAFY52_05505 [Pseudomonadota bacterium]